MIAIQISELKLFTHKLFLGNAFDAFFLSEASFTTFCTFRLDGSFQKGFFQTEDAPAGEPEQAYAFWYQVRPFCKELIKGKNPPLEFRIVFRLAPKNVEKLLSQSGLPLSPADVDGLFLNLHYKDGRLTCTTGTSLRFFTMDKSLDHVWDDMVTKYLQKVESES